MFECLIQEADAIPETRRQNKQTKINESYDVCCWKKKN
jgi:hypothetical protein